MNPERANALLVDALGTLGTEGLEAARYFLEAARECTELKKQIENAKLVTSADLTPFWIVWSPEGQQPPKVRHLSESSARKEAERMSSVHPGHRFYWLEARGFIERLARHEIVFERNEPDECPF